MNIEEALRAIALVHQDRRASLQERLDALKEIQEHVDFLVGAIEEDISREEKE